MSYEFSINHPADYAVVQNHLEGFKIILWLMHSFICCLFAFVKIVRLGTKDRPCLRVQQAWHRDPVTRQGYAVGGPTHKKKKKKKKDTHKLYMLLHYPLDKTS